MVGVIDCTHVRLKAPSMNDYESINRKNYHSNVQIICDAKLSILKHGGLGGRTILLFFKIAVLRLSYGRAHCRAGVISLVSNYCFNNFKVLQ